MYLHTDLEKKKMEEEEQHPLQSAWTWFYKPTIVYKEQSAEDWMSDYRCVVPKPFDTVEQFWAIYSHLHSLHELDCGNIYAVFRDGIKPVWEHPMNEHGYSVIVYTNKTATDNAYIDKLYQFALLTLIGANTSFAAQLNGCTLERKSGGNKLVFWMRGDGSSDSTATTAEQQQKVMQEIRDCLNVPEAEAKLCEANARVDWWNESFLGFKIALSCKAHSTTTNGGGGSSTRRNRTPPRQHHQSNNRRRSPATNYLAAAAGGGAAPRVNGVNGVNAKSQPHHHRRGGARNGGDHPRQHTRK